MSVESLREKVRDHWGHPSTRALVLLSVATGASVLLFENRQDILRHLVQVGLLWIPLLVVGFARPLIRLWRQLLLMIASVAVCAGALHLCEPLLLERLVFPLYNVDIDHRMKPEPGFLNEDGVQPDVPARDYREEDFNIVFLGDSFTFGFLVEPKELAFPFQVGRLLATEVPELHVRVVNFGWVSSSPVVQLRQLRQIGRKYKPDLVVQAFDMTDFGDDLIYLQALRQGGGPDPAQLNIFRALEVRLGLFLGVPDFRRWIADQVVRMPTDGESFESMPRHYFPLAAPLRETEIFLEPTWTALGHTHRLAGELGAGYALFILPRCQQYHREECPDVQETDPFPESDEYIYEVFEYFDDQARTAPFPVHSLLEDFRNSGVSPTVFDDDIHYNAAGHGVAARAMARHLLESGLLPSPQ